MRHVCLMRRVQCFPGQGDAAVFSTSSELLQPPQRIKGHLKRAFPGPKKKCPSVSWFTHTHTHPFAKEEKPRAANLADVTWSERQHPRFTSSGIRSAQANHARGSSWQAKQRFKETKAKRVVPANLQTHGIPTPKRPICAKRIVAQQVQQWLQSGTWQLELHAMAKSDKRQAARLLPKTLPKQYARTLEDDMQDQCVSQAEHVEDLSTACLVARTPPNPYSAKHSLS